MRRVIRWTGIFDGMIVGAHQFNDFRRWHALLPHVAKLLFGRRISKVGILCIRQSRCLESCQLKNVEQGLSIPTLWLMKPMWSASILSISLSNARTKMASLLYAVYSNAPWPVEPLSSGCRFSGVSNCWFRNKAEAGPFLQGSQSWIWNLDWTSTQDQKNRNFSKQAE